MLRRRVLQQEPTRRARLGPHLPGSEPPAGRGGVPGQRHPLLLRRDPGLRQPLRGPAGPTAPGRLRSRGRVLQERRATPRREYACRARRVRGGRPTGTAGLRGAGAVPRPKLRLPGTKELLRPAAGWGRGIPCRGRALLLRTEPRPSQPRPSLGPIGLRSLFQAHSTNHYATKSAFRRHTWRFQRRTPAGCRRSARDQGRNARRRPPRQEAHSLGQPGGVLGPRGKRGSTCAWPTRGAATAQLSDSCLTAVYTSPCKAETYRQRGASITR